MGHRRAGAVAGLHFTPVVFEALRQRGIDCTFATPHVGPGTFQPVKVESVVDALVTNFHLPRSSLLLLVAGFTGTEPMRRAYEIAVAEKYRFYSYGDAMVIL